MKGPIVISGIGTGGHYFPAAVVGREFQRRHCQVMFLVRPASPEESMARSFGLPAIRVKARGFYGKTVLGKIQSLLAFLQAVCRLLPIVRGAVAVTFGGYGSLPLIAACLIRRRPFFLFEANRIPGRATRMFAARAQRVFLGLPLQGTIAGLTQMTGVPIRDEFKHSDADRLTARNPVVLILGGSQGARRLNQLGIELKGSLPVSYRIVIISGERDYPWVVGSQNGRTRVIPFTTTPWVEFAAANVIVSRAGALAGYEILATRKPTIFIPFPSAIDDHQLFNARYFVEAGGGRLIEESGLTAASLAAAIQDLVERRGVPRSEIMLDAEHRIVDAVLGEASHAR